ncbi:MAG: hypothetical protein JWN70_4787, partial [Planctomycetaceae bacterium]|nr:hypothetical protein [Planctomycetaceae bacterium]
LVANTWLPIVMKACGIRADLVSWVFLSLMSSIVAGIISSYVIEKPALKLRDRWFPG